MNQLLILVLALVGVFGENPTRYKEFYSYDGVGNNQDKPTQGSSGQYFYIGKTDPLERTQSQIDQPNPRTMANTAGRETVKVPGNHLSMLGLIFGQFINHDLEANDMEYAWIRNFTYSIYIESTTDTACQNWPTAAPVYRCQDLTPNNPLRPRIASRLSKIYHDEEGRLRVRNNVTSFLDLSHVYGFDSQVATKVRSFQGGRLLTQNYPGYTQLLPSRALTGLPVDTLFGSMPLGEVFTQADDRVPENIGLNFFHLLWTREHNRRAALLGEAHPDWDDEAIFQEARRYTIASFQQIVFYEYLPALISDASFNKYVKNYNGYDKKVDPSTSVAFATGALRYGHTSLQPYPALTKCGKTYLAFGRTPRIDLGDDFPSMGQSGGPFTPLVALRAGGSYENIVRGLTATVGSPIDLVYHVQIGDIPNSFGTTDLLALDIGRGRLNGLPTCLALMEEYHNGNWGRGKKFPYGTSGCPSDLAGNDNADPDDCFVNLVRGNVALAQKLKTYAAKVRDIDSYICMLVDQENDHETGPLLTAILADEFIRKRDGDRFWFENEENWETSGKSNDHDDGDQKLNHKGKGSEDKEYNPKDEDFVQGDDGSREPRRKRSVDRQPTPYYTSAKADTLELIIERNFDIDLPSQPLRPNGGYQALLRTRSCA